MKLLKYFTPLLLLSFGFMRAPAQTSVAERYLLDAANRERSAAGLPALTWNDALYKAALPHAQRMAKEGDISHRFEGEQDVAERMAAAGASFSAAAENVGSASTAEQVHDAWMHSPHHRDNILDARMTSIGIAAVLQGNTLYAVQDFGRSVATLTTSQQEDLVMKGLRSVGMATVTATEGARQACSDDNGPAAHRPGFIMRWTSTDLTALPDALKSQIKSGNFQAAEVGACSGQKGESFSTYRVAVILIRSLSRQ